MNRLNRVFTSARDGRDDGVALVMVILIGMILMMLVATSAAFAVSGERKTGSDTNWNAALDAAYAGVEDYKSKLAANADYVNYRNPASTFGTGSTGGLPPTTNPAFGVGATGSWAQVPTNSGVTAQAYYRYEVDNSQYDQTGVIRIRSTGKVGNTVRSIVANVKQQGFINFLYFTDYEVGDPAQTNTACGNPPSYAWQLSGNQHNPNCSEIEFAPGDTINGPLHSNDSLLMCGGTFNGVVTTGDPISPYYRSVSGSGCSTPTFKAGKPVETGTINMPPSNANMQLETHTDLATVQRPGCLYTGPTSITFSTDSSGVGWMTVISPFTNAVQVSGDGNPKDPVTAASNTSAATAMCGKPGSSGLGSSSGVKLPVIPQNLIYVQNVPTSSSDPNYWAANKYPSGFTCTNQAAGTGWKFGSLAYPMANETAPAATPAHYGCTNGDVYVQGQLHGAVTVAAQNYVYITGDLTYSNSSQDILGLVGNNAVWIWNPFKVTTSGSNTTYTPLITALNRTVDAAILSVSHTFGVMNYSVGPSRGTLTVNGAIAQKYRGAVATTGGTGYVKSYNYDQRFQSIAPPKFLAPTTVTYGITTLEEVPPAFSPAGVAQ